MIYLLIVFLILGLVLNYLSRKYIFSGLTYSRSISKKVVEIGEEFQLTSTVENNKLLPVTFLQIIEKLPASLHYAFDVDITGTKEYAYHRISMFLMSYQRVKRTYTMKALTRGKYVFGSVKLSAGDLFGFNTNDRDIDNYQSVVVLPKRLELEDNLAAFGDYNGDVSVRRWIIEDPVLSIGIREYTGNEPQKFIHWPSSLKTGQLMVKQFDHTTDNKVLLILNVECSKPFWSQIDEKAIETIVSLSRTILEEFELQGIPYGFTTNSHISGFFEGDNIAEPSCGVNHLYSILESLGSVDVGITVEFEELLHNLMKRSDSFSTYVLLVPKVLDSYINIINRLCQRVGRVVVVTADSMNLEFLSENIIKFYQKEEKHGWD